MEKSIIPSFSNIIKTLFLYLTNSEFYDCLIGSFILTTKAMFYSIILSLFISYGYFFRFFKPISVFISKCRFLTYTGLIYVFYLIIKDINVLKMSLLLFGIIPFLTTSLISYFIEINPNLYNLCTTIRMNKWESFYEVVINGKKDIILEALRQNFAIAWMMITMVESINMSTYGLGSELYKQSKYLHLSNVIAILIVIFCIGYLFDYFFNKIRKTVFKYVNDGNV